MAVLAIPAAARELPAILPDPDGKPGASNKPVKVYILMGQSNMCGMGKSDSLKPLATGDEKFGYLVDDNGAWTVRRDVFYLYSLMGVKLHAKGWLSATVNGGRLGPEVGIGHVLGHYHDEMVLLIKVACGNRSLGFDIMPPTSRKRTGNTDQSKKYYHGWSYDNWVKAAHDFLGNLKSSFPAYKGQGYQVAGFFWWQGHKDKGMAQEKHEQLLVELINDLRAEFKAPEATFVVATIGFSGRKTGPWTGVFNAQMAVSDPRRHPKFAGNVASVDIRDMGGGGYHYGNNGATYTKVGDAMGRGMVKLLEHAAAKRAKEKAKKKAPAPKRPSRPAVDRSAVDAEKLYRTARAAERMGQRDLARTFYKKVVDKYPNTEAARKAAERLKRL